MIKARIKSIVKNNQGVNLLSIVVSVSLLTLVSAIIAPYLIKTFSEWSLTVNAKKIHQDILNTRDLAMQNDQYVKIEFLLENNEYKVYFEDKIENTWQLKENSTAFFSDKIKLTTTLPSSQIIFNRLGLPYESPISDSPAEVSDDIILVTRNIVLTKSNYQVTINIIPETGFIFRE
ncbi:hypothetical protein DID75_01100 [Candidatus Marinamargulisbacteria bacterium SCGC AG-410-N11]|nr:hypothetical protein DID75_01100 [Candidatus Marinamargulisbacteria bacterium SCGC AG-410-N11]